MITPMQMTQGPCNHYLMLQQSFQLFTTETVVLLGTTLCWKLLCSPDQSLKELEQMKGDNLCCSHLGLPARDYFHGIHLYLREQEYSHFA